MFNFLESVSTPVALNAVYQAVRHLERRVKPTVGRAKMLIPGITSSPSRLEFKLAQKIVQEIQDVEGCSIVSVEPTKVQKYVSTLSDLIQKRVKREAKYEPARAQGLLENLRTFEPTRRSKYLKPGKTLRKKTGALVRLVPANSPSTPTRLPRTRSRSSASTAKARVRKATS